jgi:hypothetical protein
MTNELHNKALQPTTLDTAKKYVSREWSVIPIPFRSKNPSLKGWQNLEISEAGLPNYFNGKPQNIGVLLGVKSNGLTDIDLDSPEAVKLADFFLPQTESIFGRKSKPQSHRLYISNFPKTEKFEFGETIVEIRSTGGQTVFPPSVHEHGEAVEWFKDGEPRKIEPGELRRAVALLASACIILKFWTKQSHLRHNLSLAISGAFLRNGFTEAETKNFIKAICFVSNDEETADRLKSVETTAESLLANRNVFGLPKLAKLTDTKLVETLCKWLEIEKPNQNTNSQEKTKPAAVKINSTFNFTTVDDLLIEPEELHSYVWEDTLICGGISICSAKPKVGKSTLARNLAVAVAEGADFLGRATLKGKVIYLCLEEKRSEIAKHFKQMGASGQDILIHTGKTPEDILQALKFAVAEIEPVLIIVDPLSRVLRVNDFNDYASMARGLEPFIDLAREFNVHILALHHDGKGGRDGSDSILGSTAIFGAVDCHLQLKKRETGRTVATTQRHGLDLPETVIELDKETGLILEKGDLQTFILQEKKEKVLDSIAENERITETDIKERVGGNSKGIISKAIRALYDEKLLFRSGEGKKNHPYLYSKNPENLENPEIPVNDSSENEKPTINADEIEAKSENQDSRFVGFSNSENLENLETTNQSKNQDGTQTIEFYSCPHCSVKIPIDEDICQSCGKQAIEF